MFKKTSYLIPVLFLISLTLNSCLQHRYSLNLREDGSLMYEYEAEGDSADLYDGLTSLPGGLPWTIANGTRIDSSEDSEEIVYYYNAEAHFQQGAEIPQGFDLQHLNFAQRYLKHPLEIKKRDIFFLVKYSLEFSFLNRKYTELYGDLWQYVPPECEALTTDDSLAAEEQEELEGKFEDGYKQWFVQMLSRRFITSLEQAVALNPDIAPDTEGLSIAETELKLFLRNIVNQIASIDTFDARAIWSIVFKPGYSILEEHLNFLGDTTFFIDMRTAGEILSKEFDVTEDLADESFEIAIKIPGKLQYTNADSIEAFMIWNFTGEDLRDSTIVIRANSVIYRTGRIIAGIVILLALVAVIIVRRN